MNLIFTSAGRRGYLLRWFKVALGPAGRVHAANWDANAAAFGEADVTVVVPPIHDPAYVPFLLAYCQKHDIRAVIPLFDIDIPVLAAHREQFSSIGVEVVVADPEVAAICNDKWRTFTFFKRHGFDTPLTQLTLEGARKELERGGMAYPVILKPRWGMGSIGVWMAEDDRELLVLHGKVEREVEQSYLRYQSAGTPGEIVLIQQWVDGQEYGLDVVNDLSGQHVATFVKKKLAMRSGETDRAVTVGEPALEALGERIGHMLKHRGNLDMDVFRTHTGRLLILEMNARFGGGYPFSHLAGADLPRAIVAWLNGRKAEPSWLSVRSGVEGVKDIVPVVRSW